MKKSIEELRSWENVIERQQAAFEHSLPELDEKYNNEEFIVTQLESLFIDALERIEENDDIWEQDAAALYFAIKRIKSISLLKESIEKMFEFEWLRATNVYGMECKKKS